MINKKLLVIYGLYFYTIGLLYYLTAVLRGVLIASVFAGILLGICMIGMYKEGIV